MPFHPDKLAQHTMQSVHVTRYNGVLSMLDSERLSSLPFDELLELGGTYVLLLLLLLLLLLR
jgi:hypothetical protein